MDFKKIILIFLNLLFLITLHSVEKSYEGLPIEIWHEIFLFRINDVCSKAQTLSDLKKEIRDFFYIQRVNKQIRSIFKNEQFTKYLIEIYEKRKSEIIQYINKKFNERIDLGETTIKDINDKISGTFTLLSPNFHNRVEITNFLGNESLFIYPNMEISFGNNFSQLPPLTPLMLACLGGHSDLVKLLLDNSADPRIKSKFSSFNITVDALYFAMKNTNEKIKNELIKLLDEYESKINQKNKKSCIMM